MFDSQAVLVVEDDDSLRGFLADNLAADGYHVLLADCVHDSLRLLQYNQPDIALLDVGLPDGSGLDVVKKVRESDGACSRFDSALPMMILSGQAAEIDRIRAFERGCDDFIAKPFSYPELRLRLSAVLKRSETRVTQGRIRVGALELDPISREVWADGEQLKLSQKEFLLLQVLAADPTRAFTKAELLREVWGYRSLGSTRTLDSHACRLRAKLAAAGGRYVQSVWGVGYRLTDSPQILRKGGGKVACNV